LERQLWAERGKPEARFGAKEHAARDDLMESSDPALHMEHRGVAFKVNRERRLGIEVAGAKAPYPERQLFREATFDQRAGILDIGLFVPKK
jgi:hypothetical protein